MRILLSILFFAVFVNSACDTFTHEDGLLIIDVQNSFLPARPLPTYKEPNYVIPPEDIVNGTIVAGALGVDTAEEIIDVINAWIAQFGSSGGRVLASLDWHPADSCSFCSTNELCGPFGLSTCGESGTLLPECPPSLANRCQDTVSVHDYDVDNSYVQWPIHCQQQTFGARFDPFLQIPQDALVVKKGFLSTNDSYSAYGGTHSVEGYPFDTADTTIELSAQPSLKQVIEANGIKRLWVTGIAIDYCVKNSILDSLGKNVGGKGTKPSTLESVILVTAAARGVSPGTTQEALTELAKAGATVLPSTMSDPWASLATFCEKKSSSSEGSVSKTTFGVVVGLLVVLCVIVIGVVLYQRKLINSNTALDMPYNNVSS